MTTILPLCQKHVSFERRRGEKAVPQLPPGCFLSLLLVRNLPSKHCQRLKEGLLCQIQLMFAEKPRRSGSMQVLSLLLSFCATLESP